MDPWESSESFDASLDPLPLAPEADPEFSSKLVDESAMGCELLLSPPLARISAKRLASSSFLVRKRIA